MELFKKQQNAAYRWNSLKKQLKVALKIGLFKNQHNAAQQKEFLINHREVTLQMEFFKKAAKCCPADGILWKST